MNIVMEIASTADPLNSDAVADELVELLKTDDVTRWAEEVRAALADSADACERPPSSCADPGTEARRRKIQSEIERLQRELHGLPSGEGDDT